MLRWKKLEREVWPLRNLMIWKKEEEEVGAGERWRGMGGGERGVFSRGNLGWLWTWIGGNLTDRFLQ